MAMLFPTLQMVVSVKSIRRRVGRMPPAGA
jgi:hypothetical protein